MKIEFCETCFEHPAVKTFDAAKKAKEKLQQLYPTATLVPTGCQSICRGDHMTFSIDGNEKQVMNLTTFKTEPAE